MTRRRSNIRLVVFVPLFAGLVFACCSLIEEPAPYVNSLASTALHASLAGYTDGQHVAGTIALTIVSDNPGTHVQRVDALMDSTMVLSTSLNTTNFRDGPHHLLFTVWLTGAESGIINLAGGVTQTIAMTLVFDQTPPTAPANFAVSWNSGNAKLTWTPTSLPAFAGYVVRRNGNQIAVITSQQTSSYVDSLYSLADFDRVGYDVGMSNNAATAFSNPVTIARGDTLALSNVWGAIAGLRDRVIIFTNSGLASCLFGSVVSTVTAATISLPQGCHVVPYLSMLSPDGSLLWTLYGPEILIFDTQTFNQTFYGVAGAFPNSVAGAWGPGRLYVADNQGNIYVLDLYATTTFWSGKSLSGSARFLSASPDGSALLAQDNDGLKRFAMRGDSVAYLSQSTQFGNINLVHVVWDDSALYVVRTKTLLERWDARLLTPRFTVNAPAGTSGVTDLAVDSVFMYAACTIVRNNAPASALYQFDKNSGQQKGYWTFPGVISWLAGSRIGRYLFVKTPNNVWMVDVGMAPVHAPGQKSPGSARRRPL